MAIDGSGERGRGGKATEFRSDYRKRWSDVQSSALTPSLFWLGRALKLLWSSPASLVGAVLAPFFRTRRVTSGLLLCEGASWPRRLGWRYRAITFGHVILCVDEFDERLLAHELVHVRQYERLGPLY